MSLESRPENGILAFKDSVKKSKLQFAFSIIPSRQAKISQRSSIFANSWGVVSFLNISQCSFDALMAFRFFTSMVPDLRLVRQNSILCLYAKTFAAVAYY